MICFFFNTVPEVVFKESVFIRKLFLKKEYSTVVVAEQLVKVAVGWCYQVSTGIIKRQCSSVAETFQMGDLCFTLIVQYRGFV